MNQTACICVALLTVAVPALARIGETPQQCEDRYGKAVQEMPGAGNLKGIRVYWKDDTEITAFFTAAPYQTPRVGLIYYRIGTNGEQRSQLPQYTDAQVKALLSTVDGVWSDYAPAPTLNAVKTDPYRTTTRITPTSSQLETRRGEASEAVHKAGVLVLPIPFAPSDSYPVTDFRHLSNTHFAFKVSNGVAIIAYDAVPAITGWATQKKLENVPEKPAPRKMSGF